jgi:ribonuclease P protein component
MPEKSFMQTFTKEERLYKKSIIDKLFSEGKGFIIDPFRIVWLDHRLDSIFPAQILIAISKKKFKRAVDRNLMKRRIREAYRKNKEQLYTFLKKNNFSYVIGIIYIADKLTPYKEIDQKIKLVLQRLQTEYEKANR